MHKFLSSKELFIYIQKAIVSSGFLIDHYEKCSNELKIFHILKISTSEKKFTLYINVRNIGSAYLPNKPFIKRRQVGKLNLEDIPVNKGNTLSMLLGVTFVDERPIFACWNPFYFIGHNTNRSCYVLDSSLDYALKNGLYDGGDCKTPVIVFSEASFSKMLDIYIKRSVVD